MAAAEGSGFISRALSILRRPWKIVTSNTYADIQSKAPIQRLGQPQELWIHDGAKHGRNDLESNHKRAQPPASVNTFDKIVALAGTPAVFCLMIAGLLTWIIIGILYPVLCLRYPSYAAAAEQLSRPIELGLRPPLAKCGLPARDRTITPGESSNFGSEIQTPMGEIDLRNTVELNVQQIDDGIYLPPDTIYDRICDSIVEQWGDNWQLYINSATAVELTFSADYARMTGDIDENPIVKLEYDYKKETTRGQRMIDYYAAILGTGVGLVCSTMVFAVWIGVGSSMQWNSNWWLIIGTYTGLVGFIDGFVLRNVYFRETLVIDGQFEVLVERDVRLGTLLGVSALPRRHRDKLLQARIAHKVGVWCSSSAMRWSETGQLICNTPTMILEGFLLLVLIQAHDETNAHGSYSSAMLLGDDWP
ncbi:low affinity iron transporter-like protein [Penicillium maclennaniae]|uniref:low affinity iron transporter-like protein n=1 Tax=Penicillium maclennaniae TaxID=1343394 RepID=UPI002540089F|nr:low affinity iron transporter-like protein [Penicillium maclennaniae]KAJ5683657.1 low affinity iron transporter-like protein [Penicillium maclennaniae]